MYNVQCDARVCVSYLSRSASVSIRVENSGSMLCCCRGFRKHNSIRLREGMKEWGDDAKGEKCVFYSFLEKFLWSFEYMTCKHSLLAETRQTGAE